MQYILSPRCTTPSGDALALSAADDGTVTVQLASNLTNNMVWTLIYSFSLSGFVLYNKAVGKALNVVSADRSLDLVDLDSLSSTSAWNAARSNDSLAIRPMYDWNVNLNVYGDGPYNPGNKVGVYSWGGGAVNETWHFQIIDTAAPYGWFHTLSPSCKADNGSTLGLSLNGADDYGNVVVTVQNADDDRQVWTPIYYFGDTTNGIVLVNKETARALAASGNNALVYTASLGALDDHSIWTLGSGPAYAIRPLYNSDMNLNVLGSGPYPPGNPVGVWSWSGGAANETWSAALIDSSLEEQDIVVQSADGYYFCVLSAAKDPKVCTVKAADRATDLVFRLSHLQVDEGVGFTVTDPAGNVYSTESRGQGGIWAVPAQNPALGLQAFYTINPAGGLWTANVKKSAAATRTWQLVGSTNTATSGISASGAFSDLSPGKQKAIYDLITPPSPSFDPVPPEFCYFCIAQGYVIAALMIATFVFWAGPVVASSAVVLYAERLLGIRAAMLVSAFNTLKSIWDQGGPNSTLYNLIRRLCELEGFCKKASVSDAAASDRRAA